MNPDPFMSAASYTNSPKYEDPLGDKHLNLEAAQDAWDAGARVYFKAGDDYIRCAGRPMFTQLEYDVCVRPNSGGQLLLRDGFSAKSRPDLFPARALLLGGDVLAFGETKHPDQKWKTMTVAEHLAASQRHYLQWQSGDKTDIETGVSHLVHAMVRMAMAVELEAKQ